MLLVGPFLVDAGLSLTAIGTLNGLGVTALGLAGALGGGWILRRIGAYRVMGWTLGIQMLVMLAFAVVAHLKLDAPVALMAIYLASAGTLALGFVALYSELMGRASLDQAGVDFTLFQSMDSIVSLVGWRIAGYAGDRLGYAACFAAAAVLALGVSTLIPRFARAQTG